MTRNDTLSKKPSKEVGVQNDLPYLDGGGTFGADKNSFESFGGSAPGNGFLEQDATNRLNDIKFQTRTRL